MSKLKKIQKKYGMLNESFAWERQEGKPLPTLADVQAKYNASSITEQTGEESKITLDKLKTGISPSIDVKMEIDNLRQLIRNIKRSSRLQGKNDADLILDLVKSLVEKSSQFYASFSNAMELAKSPDPNTAIEKNPFGI